MRTSRHRECKEKVAEQKVAGLGRNGEGEEARGKAESVRELCPKRVKRREAVSRESQKFAPLLSLVNAFVVVLQSGERAIGRPIRL